MPEEIIPQESQKALLNAYIASTNIAEELDGDVLDEIGIRVVEDYEIDKRSLEEWEESNEEALKLARQLAKNKFYAGDRVSNVKYPILATAAIHFSARTYPNIVDDADVVKCRVIGRDQDGKKATRSARVSEHMSYQMLEQMGGWEDDMDQLLTILPITGVMFKKTYFDPISRTPMSGMLLPDEFTVNYFSKSIESAPVQTHKIELYPNEIEERIRAGIYLEFEYKDIPAQDDENKDEDNRDQKTDSEPHVFLEQHRFWDLDDDGYQEPYIVTVHKATSEVVRITARYDIDGVETDEKGKILKITPIQHFTKYPFMPSFDGSVYGMGFGVLLAPLNEVVNTTLNQLIDAGTLSNRQSGFIGSGINLGKGGDVKFKQGEWKQIKTIGDDIRKNIVPLPVREPSMVLFQLLGLMIDASKELSSVTDVLRGEQPQGDVPATTTLAMIEQGLKVFSAVFRRIHRSLKSEFKKIRRMNVLYLSDEEYNRILDTEDTLSAKADYGNEFLDIIPISSTADVSDVQKIIKAQTLLELRGQGLNDGEINRRYLEALQIPDIEKILTPPPPKEPFEVTMQKAELELRQREVAVEEGKLSLEQKKLEVTSIKTQADAIKSIAQAEAAEDGQQVQAYKTVTDRIKYENDAKQKAEENRLKEKEIEENAKQRAVSGVEGAPSNQGSQGTPTGA